MARQSNASYWAQRIKNMEDALKDQSYSYVENMERRFEAAQAEIEKELALWYQRLADNNEITLADAKKLLTKNELAEFKWTVGEYIAYGQQNALDGAWMKQLENASARVHISRLDAMKLQLQQQAEVLYSNQLDYIDAAARSMYTGSYYHTAFEVQRGLGVGWSMQSINEQTISKVLSRPWTTDNQTFRDRCWTNKQSLVNSVNTNLTQMIIRGEAPDRAIAAISKQFNVAKGKAGRLIMTESAAFASAAQKDCYKDLDIERYKVIETFDDETCSDCAAMDGKVFKMSDYEVGITAPPFHPWCRGCTIPHFEDMADMGERWTRNADGTTSKIPANISYSDWKKQYIQPEKPISQKSAKDVIINPSEKVTETLHNKELEISKLSDHEEGVTIDRRTGKVLQHAQGQAHSVSPDEKLLRDNIFTHNHPSGGTFSSDDIKSFVNCGLYEVRACTASGTVYSLKKGENITEGFLDTFTQQVPQGYKLMLTAEQDLIKSLGRGNYKYPNIQKRMDEIMNEGLKAAAEKHGYIFTIGEI